MAGSYFLLPGAAIPRQVHSGHMVNTLFRRHGLHLLRGEGIGAWFDAALVLVAIARLLRSSTERFNFF